MLATARHHLESFLRRSVLDADAGRALVGRGGDPPVPQGILDDRARGDHPNLGRRSFLGWTGALAGSLILPSCPALARPMQPFVLTIRGMSDQGRLLKMRYAVTWISGGIIDQQLGRLERTVLLPLDDRPAFVGEIPAGAAIQSVEAYAPPALSPECTVNLSFQPEDYDADD